MAGATVRPREFVALPPAPLPRRLLGATRAHRLPAMFEARFQTFDDPEGGAATGPRVAALRAELARRGLTGFVVPRADQHQNEYLPASEERLAWLTGFTGSAAVAIVLADRAAIFVDGRYTLQVRDQVDTEIFSIEHMVDGPPEAWLETNLPAGAKVGYDPWLHTVDGAQKLAKACTAADAALVPTGPNPIDGLWTDRPQPPLGPVTLHALQYAGEDSAAKLVRLRAEIDKLNADALVVSNPQGVAWLFNIRGADVAHTPLPLSFAVVSRAERPAIYIDGRKLANTVRHALEEHADVREPSRFLTDLAALGGAKQMVRLDQASAADALAKLVIQAGGCTGSGTDPITLMKSVKNDTEIAGARAAQLRDGAAVVRFLAWFEREAPAGKLTEIDAVAALESFRRETGKLKDVSFPTIAGAGPNGAIVHYRVTRKSNRRIARHDLFLIDSG